MPVSIEQHVEWIADAIEHMRAQGIETMEADAEAEADWVAHVNDDRRARRSSCWPTRGTWAPTSPASRACSCRTSAASAPTARSATRSRDGRLRGVHPEPGRDTRRRLVAQEAVRASAGRCPRRGRVFPPDRRVVVDEQLDLVAIRVAQVDRLADPVVGDHRDIDAARLEVGLRRRQRVEGGADLRRSTWNRPMSPAPADAQRARPRAGRAVAADRSTGTPSGRRRAHPRHLESPSASG